MTLGIENRDERLQSLLNSPLDILVVGGGITGVATARDAAMRGLRVGCVEKRDFGYGTSSRSSKLIHGGLRYLEQMQFRLVFEGTHERALLRTLAPHLVRPIPFLFPVYKSSKRSPWIVRLGLWLYDLLAGRRRYRRHKGLKAKGVQDAEPLLLDDSLRGGALYYDCMTDDARLCLENALSAAEEGATILNYCSFVRDLSEEGQIRGAVIRDECTGQEYEIQCRSIIHCAGPWTDDVRKKTGYEESDMIRTTKGVHLVFPWKKLPLKQAVVLNSREDGRVVFAIPRGRVTLVGTTDTDYTSKPDTVRATRDDVDYLMATLNHYFHENAPTEDDIQATYAGLRPLVKDDASSPYDVSREHTIVRDPRGVITIGGGKYTTYRRMADDCVEAVMDVLGLKKKKRPTCPTANALLPGALLDGETLDSEAITATLNERRCDPEVATYRATAYGSRAVQINHDKPERLVASLPVTWDELQFAVYKEDAVTPEDFLVRRTALFYEAPDQGLECLEAVAEQMAEWFNWSDSIREQHIAEYRSMVDTSRAWKTDPKKVGT